MSICPVCKHKIDVHYVGSRGCSAWIVSPGGGGSLEPCPCQSTRGDTEGTAWVRKLLGQLDRGELTTAELESQLSDAYFSAVLEHLERLEPGEKLMATGSCCCSSHAPERSFTVRVTIQPHGYTIERLP